MVDGLIELIEAATQRCTGCGLGGNDLGQAGAQQAIIATRAEQDGAPALLGHAVAMRLGDALDQAISIAQREKAKLHGLHIVARREDVEGADALAVKARFEQTCKEASVEGKLAVDAGDVTQRIFERAVLTDLVVLKITNPPGKGISALQSPFRTILAEASRPLLTVPLALSVK